MYKRQVQNRCIISYNRVMNNLKSDIQALVASSFRQIHGNEPAEFSTDYCEPKYGHCATNIALVNSKNLGLPPMEVANKIASKLEDEVKLSKVEVQEPGSVSYTHLTLHVQA